jgi:hypothetical protein
MTFVLASLLDGRVITGRCAFGRDRIDAAIYRLILRGIL